jgi:hypothetical protein
MKTLMAINDLYKISANELYEIRRNYIKEDTVFNFLPKYTIRDNGKIDYAENWLQFSGQFIDENNDPLFYLFDYQILDNVLNEEFLNMGIDDFFDDDTNFNEIFKHMKVHSYNDWKNHALTTTNYILIDWEYEGEYDYWTGESDYELILNEVKYLDLHKC